MIRTICPGIFICSGLAVGKGVLFMPFYTPLSKTDHARNGWLKSGSFSHAAKDMGVPVLMEELAYILPTMPLAFKKISSDKDQFELQALQSLIPGLNFYVLPDGRWMGGYIPSAYRGYPFKILPETETGKPALHFEQDSGLMVEKTHPDAQAFFDDSGALSPVMTNIVSFLEQWEQGRAITQAAVDALVLHKVLTPWEIKANKDGKETLIKEDLYKIDQAVLNTLSPAVLQVLQQKQALAVAFAQIFSQPRLSGFARLHHIHGELNKTGTAAPVPDLDRIFGKNDDDPIKFS
jgi:hypothetical protein